MPRTDLEYYTLNTAMLIDNGARETFVTGRRPVVEVQGNVIKVTWPSGKVIALTANEFVIDVVKP